MAWIITQSGDAVNLDHVSHLYFEFGTGRNYEPVAILWAAESGRLEEVGSPDFPDDRVMAVTHELCVVRERSGVVTTELRPLLRELLDAARNQAVVDIVDVVTFAGFELWHRMDHHP